MLNKNVVILVERLYYDKYVIITIKHGTMVSGL